MSTRDVTVTPGKNGRRGQRGASPRVAATLNVNVAARDRSGNAVILSGTIGSRPPYDASPMAKPQRGPGELGRAPEAPPKPAPRPAAAAAAESESATSPASGGGASGGRRRRDSVVALRPAPTTALSGLPGLGVDLGEIGSAARGTPGGAGPARRPAKVILGRGLQSIPSLADVSVSIGGDTSRGAVMRRLVAPLRALAARRSRREAGDGRVSPPPATDLPTRPATPSPAATASGTLAPDPVLDAAAAARPGRLRRASRYLVNGILDVAIRRFRARPR